MVRCWITTFSSHFSHHWKWIGFFLLLLAASRFCLPNLAVQAAPLIQSNADGQAIFQQQCTGCHTIGSGRLVGPDLQDVTQRQGISWIKTFIADPSKMVSSGDATAKQLVAQYGITMPTLGLSSSQIDAVVAYLENPTTVPQPAANQPVLSSMVGDPARGQLIFSGSSHLLNGGTACISCHTVQGVATLGGGNLGPNLTHVVQRYGGQAGMASTLASLPFPTMQGVFATRPLSPAEQADLLAFLVRADQTQPVVPLQMPFYCPMWIIGITGLILFFAFLFIFWPRQRVTMLEIIRKRSISHEKMD